MTNFNAGDPGAGQGGEQTSFVAPGVAPAPTNTPEDTTVVLELDGRKFTKADLIKKITSADQHINTLTGELKEQRTLLVQVNEKLGKQVTAAEILAQIKKDGQPATATPTQAAPAAAAPTAAEIAEQVRASMTEDAQKAQREANWKEATEAVTKAFGAATNQRVAQAAAEAGLTVAQAADLARTSPKAFLKLFPNLNPEPRASALPEKGRVNTQSFQQSPDTNTGFSKASGVKAKTSIYLNRLKELGL